MVAVPAMVALVVLFFVRGPVPWLGSLRCSWPCCRPSPVCSCRLPPVRIAAGVVVSVGAFVGALVGLVAFKEQGGAGDPRPGRFHLAPGLLSAWSCRSRAGLLRLVPDRRRRCRCPPGAGRVILRRLRGLVPVAGLLVLLVVGVAVPVLVVLFFARGPVWPGSLRHSWPCCRSSSVWSCHLSPVRIAAGVVVPFGVAVPVALVVPAAG